MKKTSARSIIRNSIAISILQNIPQNIENKINVSVRTYKGYPLVTISLNYYEIPQIMWTFSIRQSCQVQLKLTYGEKSNKHIAGNWDKIDGLKFDKTKTEINQYARNIVHEWQLTFHNVLVQKEASSAYIAKELSLFLDSSDNYTYNSVDR